MARRHKRKLSDAKAIQLAQYGALRLVSTILHCLPLETVMRLAAFTGDLMYLLMRRRRERAMENVRLSFPGRSDAFHRRLTRDSFRLLPFIGVEFMLVPRYVKLERLARHFRLGQLSEVMRHMIARDRGVILLTGHYGNWEILGYLLAVMGFETDSVARPIDNEYIDRYVLNVRQRKGQRIISKRGSTLRVARILARHGAVAFIADQDAGPKGLFIDFFGRPASTYRSIGMLATRYDTPVVIGCARRLGYDFRFQIDVEDVIRPEEWKRQPDPIVYITRRYTKAIERSIRREPGQYLWLHRRWKTQPPGGHADGPSPAAHETSSLPAPLRHSA